MEFNNIDDLINYVGDLYDHDAMEIDYLNNNLSLDNPDTESYYKPRIVADSWINGQKKQARSQFAQFGLTGDQLTDFMDDQSIIDLSS